MTSHKTALSIDKWTLQYELDYLRLNVDDMCANENIRAFIPSDEFKLYGLGNSCQNVKLYRTYVQNIASACYGDGGTLHIDKNGCIFGDML